MTVSEKHAEWISLLEVSGPFLAVSVLEDAFPQGLDKVETPFRQRIRSAYDEWRDAIDEDDPQLEAIHREWVSLVVRDFLEYDASVLRSGDAIPASLAHHDVASDTTFRPDFAVMSGDKARLLISVTPPGTRLNDPLPSDSWLASPAERLIQLCRTSGVPLGIVTNGERWMVVSAPADGGSSRASWYARLWLQEPVTLQAFAALLGVRRCFGEESHTLDALIRRSLEHQDEITDTLGEQVRRAVEVLVQALDRADQDRNRTLLQDVTPAQLFEAGLTVMMRLVVLLCAEERKLLLLGEPVYDQNYAITTLRAQLVEQASHGLEILERRQDAWSRLLATFRGIYGGIHHETLRLPPLGGSLFDPDRFPFLEGRAPGTHWHDTAASPLPIDNRTVLLLLNALQVLEHKSGAQMLSYEALDVEQIGHVYEGLLERTVKRVPEVTLGLMANSTVRKKTGHPELPLSILEKTARSGRSALIEFLNEKTGRSKSALTNDLELPLKPTATNRLLLACGNDLALMERVRPFGQLLRTDSWEDPLVYPQDAFIVTHGVGRRETGSHYTPKSLTEPIVQHTLEPLVYVGPAEGVPRVEWKLKAPYEILALKVCDMAMGSGAFLVQSCRYLADRLVEAWDAEEKAGRVISVEGIAFDRGNDAELLPRDQAERLLIARRLVASRCLYGVDINPMAVELAKLSLWLATMMRNRPFGFLDHALKCGDSILGVSQIKQLERFSMRNPDGAEPLLETANLSRHIQHAVSLRRELEVMPSHTAEQIKEKSRLHGEAELQLRKLRASADFLVAAELNCAGGSGWETQRAIIAGKTRAAWNEGTAEFQRLGQIELNGRRPFHWPLEFPEVFETTSNGESARGFDGFVGNPPFITGKSISRILGEDYHYVLKATNVASKGAADLCVFFLRRAWSHCSASGFIGMIVTKSIAEGDSREVGYEFLLSNGAQFTWVTHEIPWPGGASVIVSLICLSKARWQGDVVLNGNEVSAISSKLDFGEEEPTYALKENKGRCSDGVKIQGDGFIISPEERRELLKLEPKNTKVISPYLTGDDITSGRSADMRDWIINFGLKSLEEAKQFREPFKIVSERVRPYRDALTGQIHEPCFWKFWDKREAFIKTVKNYGFCFACPATAKFLLIVRVGSEVICSHSIKMFSFYEWNDFGILQSTIHEIWAREQSGKLGVTLAYNLSRAFATFPFPKGRDANDIGEIYFQNRQAILDAEKFGLTALYNKFHDPTVTGSEIIDLRNLHRRLDAAVSAAYGWDDLSADEGAALRFDFHETKQGVRWTVHPDVRRAIVRRLLSINHQRYEEEVAAGLHGKKGAGQTTKKPPKAKIDGEQELHLDFGPTNVPTPKSAKEAGSTRVITRSSGGINQTELLNAIFTCAARREYADRDDLAKEVATALGFQRLRDKTREVIASGFNSAIRRGLIGYEGSFIVRLAPTYADLELDTLVKAIAATVRPGRVYTTYEVFYNAADYLGCKRLGEPFRESLQSALNAASRRGLITRRGDDVRKAE